ncbi:mechanosensitive ion channel family protein [Allonocardiopsis opalescens]|uniref:Putative transporter (Transmembrane protein) n=1 Tax=Allonocardiopsis opalescens TaxID=1144618 RepID=A0A2T0QDG0_9ACTN|nr:hypothetical protein [Allonocardiopsis opalescens]PRY01984.1 putative transporter (transmembrane protein) [Allonocardiopsis opalescens]
MSGSLAAVNFGQGISQAWNAVASFVPALVAFLVILIVGWLIAKLIGRWVGRGLARVGFDRLAERGGVAQYLERSQFTASTLVGRIIYYVGLLFVLTLAFNVFGPNPISNLLSEVIAWLPRAAVALVIIVVAVALAKGVRDIISGALSGLGYGRVLATIAAVFIIALGVIAALNQIGVATTVTTPVLVAILATVGGILVVGVGGGLIRPMQQRWEHWLNRAEEETDRMRSTAYAAGRSDAMKGGPSERRTAGRGASESDQETMAEHRTSAPGGGMDDPQR